MAVFLRRYPQYRLDDIYGGKSWRDGGITLTWLYFLIEQAEQEVVENFKIEAMFHGAKIESSGPGQSPKSEKGYMFKHPDEYKNMTEEERKAATQEMMRRIRDAGFPVKTMKRKREE